MEREIKHFVLNKMNECAWVRQVRITAQKMKFSIKGFFSKCDQIRSFLRIWSHLLKKSLMANFKLFPRDIRVEFLQTFYRKKITKTKEEAQAKLNFEKYL